MTGDADYLIRAMVADVPAVQRLIVDEITRIPGLASIRTSLALKQVVHGSADPQPALARLRPDVVFTTMEARTQSRIHGGASRAKTVAEGGAPSRWRSSGCSSQHPMFRQFR
jgi:hypothetical protein